MKYNLNFKLNNGFWIGKEQQKFVNLLHIFCIIITLALLDGEIWILQVIVEKIKWKTVFEFNKLTN